MCESLTVETYRVSVLQIAPDDESRRTFTTVGKTSVIIMWYFATRHPTSISNKLEAVGDREKDPLL